MQPMPPQSATASILEGNPLGDDSLVSRLSDEQQEQFAMLLDRYVSELEAGSAPSVAELVERYPEFAAILPEYLEGLEKIQQSMAQTAASATTPNPEEASESQTPRQIGEYTIERVIGRGGMGVVYEARQASLNRRVALKVLPFAAVLDQRQISRFRTEAQAAAGLHHPNIVPVFAVGQERGVHFYAMQFIEGQSLREAIDGLKNSERPNRKLSESVGGLSELEAGRKRWAESQSDSISDSCLQAVSTSERSPTNGLEGASTSDLQRSLTDDLEKSSTVDSHQQLKSTVSLRVEGELSTVRSVRSTGYFRAVAELGIQMADALAHAHEYGVVHRDIKPSNLMIDQQGKLWVTDFGLARVQSEMSVTLPGDVVGTLRYMSPEQARGRGDLVDGRSDVYAVGATLYEMLTLQPAHPGEDHQTLVQRITSADPTPPRKLNASIPIDLETIVMRAMERSRDDRYTSATALADDLRRFLAGRPTEARRPTVVDHAVKWIRRHGRLVGAMVACLALVTIVSATAAVMVARAQQQTATALAESEASLKRAESHYRQAREVVDHFGGDLSDRLVNVPGSEPIRRELLADTLRYYQSFLASSGDDASLSLEDDLASTQFKSGVIAEKLGDLPGAAEHYRAALTRTTTDPLLRVMCLNNLAHVLHQQGSSQLAREQYAEAIMIARAAADEQPTNAAWRSRLAEPLANLGMLESRSGNRELALTHLGEAVKLLQQAVASASHEGTETMAEVRIRFARNLAATLNNYGFVLREVNAKAAFEACQSAAGVLQQLAKQLPGDSPVAADVISNWAMTSNNLGALSGTAGDWNQAAQHYQVAVEQLGRLVRRSPLAPQRRRELAIAQSNLGLALSRIGKQDESEQAFFQAQQVLVTLVEDFPDDPRYLSSLAALSNNRGVALRAAGELEQAAAAFEQATRQQQEVVKNTVQTGEKPFSDLLAQHYANYADVLRKLGRDDEAEKIEQAKE